MPKRIFATAWCMLIAAFLSLPTVNAQTLAPNAVSDAEPVRIVPGQVAVLDPTDGFLATPGTPLRVVWTWVSRPPVSVAALASTTSLRPSFTPEVAGRYVARATFFAKTDTAGTSPLHVVDVVADTGNLPPVATIRARTMPGGAVPLRLDGTGSTDADRLTYQWSVVTAPPGGNATFSNAAVPMPTLSLTGDGVFTVGLRVQDTQGQLSGSARFIVKFFGGTQSLAPVASLRFDALAATAAQAVRVEPWASTGTDTFALVPVTGLAFVPSGGSTTMSSPGANTRGFTPVAGDYLVALAVQDNLFDARTQMLVAANGTL